jgi:hypothetical protein
MEFSNWLLDGAEINGRLFAVRGRQRLGVPTWVSLGRILTTPDRSFFARCAFSPCTADISEHAG